VTVIDAITVPEDEAQLQEFLNDSPKVLNAIKAGKFGEIMNAAAQIHLQKDADLAAQFKEQMQIGLVNFMREQGAAPQRKVTFDDVKAVRRGYLNSRNKGQVYNAAAPAAALDKVFDGCSDFFRATLVDGPLRSASDRDALAAKMEAHRKVVQNAASSTSPSDGGFLIPEILRSDIQTLMLEDAVVRPHATVIPMQSLKVPIPANDTTTHVGSIYGGINFAWGAEGAAGVDTSAKFAQVELDAKKLFGYAGVPRELVADSPAFDAWFAAKFPSAAGYFEDDAFLNGTGIEQPQGVYNSPAMVSVDRTTNSVVKYADVVAMYAQMYPASRKRAIWVCSPDTLPQLMELSFSPDGTNYVPVMLWQANAVAAPEPTLLGRPLVISEKAPKLGAGNELAFIDFSEYLIGDRQQMELDSSEHYLFGTDKIAFKVIERVDGRPWVQSAVTPRNGSTNKLSPYVGLSATHT
jgi:HK97 family phage major capsid protein